MGTDGPKRPVRPVCLLSSPGSVRGPCHFRTPLVLRSSLASTPSRTLEVPKPSTSVSGTVPKSRTRTVPKPTVYSPDLIQTHTRTGRKKRRSGRKEEKSYIKNSQRHLLWTREFLKYQIVLHFLSVNAIRLLTDDTLVCLLQGLCFRPTPLPWISFVIVRTQDSPLPLLGPLFTPELLSSTFTRT